MTQSFKSHVGFAKESTWGTIVAPTVWIPCLSFTFDEERRREIDKGIRAKAALDFGAYAGVQFAKPSYEFNLYPDECGRWYSRVLGAGSDSPASIGAPSAAAAAGAGMGTGNYKYQITFRVGNASGGNGTAESGPGTEGLVTTTGGNNQVNLTNIPLGPQGTTARGIYRTAVAGVSGTEKLVTTLNDNTTTVYLDAASDASIASNAAVPSGTGTVHTMTLQSAVPASDTVSDFYGIASKERRFAGAYVSSVNTKFETKTGFATQKVDFVTQAADTGVTETTPTFPSDQPIMGWTAQLQVAGSANIRLLSFEMDMKRNVDPIFGANNSQTPSNAEVFPLEHTGKCSFYMDTTDTEYSYFQTGATLNKFDLTIAGGTSIVEFVMNQFLWEKVTIARSNPGFVLAEATFRAIYNSTDNGTGTIKIVNLTTAAY